MKQSDVGDIKIYQGKQYTRGRWGRFISHVVKVSSLELETTYTKNKNFTYLNYLAVDRLKGKAVTEPLYIAPYFHGDEVVTEVDIYFESTSDLFNEVEEHTTEVKKEFNLDNMFDYQFELENLVGFCFLEIDRLGSRITIKLDSNIYDLLVANLKKDSIADIKLEITYYSVFSTVKDEDWLTGKEEDRYRNPPYQCVLPDEEIGKPDSFGVIREIVFCTHQSLMQVGNQALFNKENLEAEKRINQFLDAIDPAFKAIFSILTIGFSVVGVLILISLFL